MRNNWQASMLDTTSVTTAIAAMIRSGTEGHQLLAAVARKFPELTRTEFEAALQAAAERQAARRH